MIQRVTNKNIYDHTASKELRKMKKEEEKVLNVLLVYTTLCNTGRSYMMMNTEMDILYDDDTNTNGGDDISLSLAIY